MNKYIQKKLPVKINLFVFISRYYFLNVLISSLVNHEEVVIFKINMYHFSL